MAGLADAEKVALLEANLDNQKWRFRFVMEKDKKIYRSDTWKIFRVLYNVQNDELVPHWYMCSVCERIVFCVLKNGTYPVSRHDHYLRFIEQQNAEKRLKQQQQDEEEAKENVEESIVEPTKHRDIKNLYLRDLKKTHQNDSDHSEGDGSERESDGENSDAENSDAESGDDHTRPLSQYLRRFGKMCISHGSCAPVHVIHQFIPATFHASDW